MDDLPTPGVPIHTLHLPSNGKEIRVRPFLVKEEKLLLMAAQSKDMNEVIAASKRAVKDCLVDSDVDVDKLTFFDVDYLIVALRAKSVAPTIEVSFKCRQMIDDVGECGQIFPVNLDIANSVVVKEDIPDKIDLGNGMGVKMKYPNYSNMKQAMTVVGDLDRSIQLLYRCVDYIYVGEKIYSMKDYEYEKFEAFVGGLTEENFDKMVYWTDHLPRYAVEAEKACTKCGTVHKLRYDDMSSFFFIMFGYDNLMNWFKTNFNLVQHHKYSLSDIENMVPWERHLYIDLLKEHIKAEKERTNDLKALQKRR